jgi:ABC-type molybdate transport system ATPase subunit
VLIRIFFQNYFLNDGSYLSINCFSAKIALCRKLIKIILAEKLQLLLETIDVANVLTEPLTRTIENLLRISAAAMKSEEASVLIRDGADGDLRFLSAIGKVAGQLLNLRIPAGKGIAGFVISSGQRW